MHRALFVHDVLDQLFAPLTQSPQALAALACTCKHFALPALRLLWRDALGVQQYAELMPPWAREHLKLVGRAEAVSFWHLANKYSSALTLPLPRTFACSSLPFATPVAQRTLSLPPPETEGGWERFLFYSRMVRTLNADPQTKRYTYRLPNTHILRILALCGEPPFPLLEKFNMYIEDDRGLLSLPAFLSPRLATLDLHTGHQVTLGGFTSFLKTLPSLAPALKAVKATAALSSEPEFQLALLSTVSALPQLESLATEGLPIPQFFALLPPSLKHVSIDLSWLYLPDTTDQPPLPSCTLPQLETLSFSSPSAHYAQRLLSSLTLPSLLSLHLELQQTQSPLPELSALLSLLAHYPTLQTLHLLLSPLNLSLHPPSLFLPLALLPHIREFTLSLPSRSAATGAPYDGLSLSDAEVCVLARGWRELRTLRISPDHPGGRKPGVTLKGLGEVRRECRGLEWCEVDLDLSVPLSTSISHSLPSGSTRPAGSTRRLKLGSGTSLPPLEKWVKAATALACVWEGVVEAEAGGRRGVDLWGFCRVVNGE